jgi:polyisoprenoid-binding protein YceI
MQKILLIIVLSILWLVPHAQAQKHFSKEAKVAFNASGTSKEKIDATTLKGEIIVDATTGGVEMTVLIKSFHFLKALMEQQFNENYLESSKYPASTFVGKIAEVDKLKQNGVHLITITGQLSLHGVTKDVTAQGALTVSSGSIESVAAKLSIGLEDFKVDIPSIVKNKIASQANIDISASLQPYKQ